MSRGRSTLLGIVALACVVSVSPVMGQTMISTAAQLQGMSGSGDYMLANDIDCASLGTFTPIAGSFTGTLDGDGYEIQNLTVSGRGLFYSANGSALIKNVTLANVDVAGTSYVGALVGYFSAGTIDNCHVTSGQVIGTGRPVGGFAAEVVNGVIRNSSNAAYVQGQGGGSGYAQTGGFIGYCYSGVNLENCNMSGDVVGAGLSQTGGLIGVGSGSVSNCSVSGSVTAGGTWTGGLIGDNRGQLSNSHYAGTGIVGGGSVGGAVGENRAGASVSGCTSSATITAGSTVGGLIGLNRGNVTASSASGSVTGVSNLGGLIGLNYADLSQLSADVDVFVTGSTSNHGQAGGLVATNVGPLTMRECYALGNVGPAPGNPTTGIRDLGGLAGQTYWGTSVTVIDCYARGDVNAVSQYGRYVGGLIGYGYTTDISNSYATGNVTGSNYVGGLVGNARGPISNCYAADGSVSGSSGGTGGLVGTLSGTVTDCYWSNDQANATGSGAVASATKITDPDDFHAATQAPGAQWNGGVWSFSGLDDACLKWVATCGGCISIAEDYIERLCTDTGEIDPIAIAHELGDAADCFEDLQAIWEAIPTP